MNDITVFWFKRDLRIHDNEALMAALSQNRPLLLVSLLEPSILREEHTDVRHLRFIKESIADLNRRLEPFGTRVLCLEEEVIDALSTIHSTHRIHTLVSTRETGLDVTFQRDRHVAAYCASADSATAPHGLNIGKRTCRNPSYDRICRRPASFLKAKCRGSNPHFARSRPTPHPTACKKVDERTPSVGWRLFSGIGSRATPHRSRNPG